MNIDRLVINGGRRQFHVGDLGAVETGHAGALHSRDGLDDGIGIERLAIVAAVAFAPRDPPRAVALILPLGRKARQNLAIIGVEHRQRLDDILFHDRIDAVHGRVAAIDIGRLDRNRDLDVRPLREGKGCCGGHHRECESTEDMRSDWHCSSTLSPNTGQPGQHLRRRLPMVR